MKTRGEASLFGRIILLAMVTTVALSGCSQVMILTASPTPTLTATQSADSPAPPLVSVVVDPVVAAQAASGLSPEKYQEVTEAVGALDINTSSENYLAEMVSIGDQYGKPVAAIVHYICGPTTDSPGTPTFGMTGALNGAAPPGCGTAYESSLDLAIAKVKLRAETKQWGDSDYILVFADRMSG
jgi:hypothetical protein